MSIGAARNVFITEVPVLSARDAAAAETRLAETRSRALCKHSYRLAVTSLAAGGAATAAVALGITAWPTLTQLANHVSLETPQVALAGLCATGAVAAAYGAVALLQSAARAAKLVAKERDDGWISTGPLAYLTMRGAGFATVPAAAAAMLAFSDTTDPSIGLLVGVAACCESLGFFLTTTAKGFALANKSLSGYVADLFTIAGRTFTGGTTDPSR